MQIEGKKALVLGAGRSGVASATFLAERGAAVALHDKKEIENWSEVARSLKESHNVGLISGQFNQEVCVFFDQVRHQFKWRSIQCKRIESSYFYFLPREIGMLYSFPFCKCRCDALLVCPTKIMGSRIVNCKCFFSF